MIDLPSGASQGMERVTSVTRKKGNSFSGNHDTVSGRSPRPLNFIFTKIIGLNRKRDMLRRAFVPVTKLPRIFAGAVLIAADTSYKEPLARTATTFSSSTIISLTGV